MRDSGDCLGLEIDRQRRVEGDGDGDALETRRARAAGLEAGDRGLDHAGELGPFALASASFVAHAPQLLPQLERELCRRIGGLDRKIANAGSLQGVPRWTRSGHHP